MKDVGEIREIISSRLVIARKRAGLSQAQVASKLGLKRPAISEIEAGRRRVAVEELVQFADLFHVEIDWLAGKDADGVNPMRDDLQLAARNAVGMKSEDLEKVIEMLTSLKGKGK